ncbi:urease accessory protein [Spinactinospora alkalitolerans]|uniref:Urease accessory protein UreD n=1 Tax=Spinactinospora alkalitolerans TaxID=687207 RepID=A0A852TMH7_9ACTN|nr:urease accessory protein UreD [Spinactinospora alkalitolerans]NYE45138.1 urease accessory protein [Spinactinospora alkalitolerans]
MTVPPAPPSVRHDAAWYTPPDLPAALRAFDTPVPNLAVGRAGKVGLLELALAPAGGRTRVTHQYQRTPLYVLQPIHLDPHRPDMAFVYLQQSGDGFVQGDRYRVDVDAAPGAAAHVTTQTPTKVYGMGANFATQMVHLRAGAGAVLEYLPDPVVPFRGSRFLSRTRLTVHPEATAVLGEVLLPGRVAHGETHAYDFHRVETEVRAWDGRLLVADQLELAPPAAAPSSPGRLGPFSVLATLYILAPAAARGELHDRIHTAVDALPGVLAGVSELPNDAGIGVRLLAATSTQAAAAVHAAWNRARLHLLDAPAPDLRKG